MTKADGNVIYELAGKPALERLVAQASADLTEDEVEALAAGGLQLGRVIDEHREQFATGDFLIRNVLGTDRRSGAVAVGDVVPVGVTVQFHLRDATDGRRGPERASCRGAVQMRPCCSPAPAAARGCSAGRITMPRRSSTISAPSRPPDASLPARSGRSAGRNFLHGFTASLALFRQSADPPWRDGRQAVR